MGSKILKNIGLLVLLVVLCFPMTYVFGWIYKNLISHPVSGSFWGPDPILFAGFLMSSMFLLSIYFAISLKRAIAIILCIFINVGTLILFWGIWVEDLIILIVSSLAGYLLAELLKLTYKKIHK